jgi:hypothetical protein
MFNSGILDVAIGLTFVYLLLSLLCSAFNEMIEARLKMRASDLERGIRELLNDPTGNDLVKRLYEHPLVYGLFQGDYDPAKISKDTSRYPSGSNLPSYIPARNFALALMDIVLPAKPATSSTSATSSGAAGSTTPYLTNSGTTTALGVSATPTGTAAPSTATTSPLQPLRDEIRTIQNPKVEQALMTLVDAAGNNMNQARENIENWYNSTMDRVAGWYKRRVQKIVLVLGLGVTIAINADTITIANSLSHDVAMRNSLVSVAQEYARANTASAQKPSPNPKSEIEACKQDANSPECKIGQNLSEIQKLGLPVGWNIDDPRTVPRNLPGWLVKLLGWLLTATAMSLWNKRYHL